MSGRNPIAGVSRSVAVRRFSVLERVEMAERMSAGDGDVICVEYERNGRKVYVLRIVPGPDQIAFRSQERATSEASAYARRQEVRAWLIVDGGGFVLLDDCRSAGQTRPGRT